MLTAAQRWLPSLHLVLNAALVASYGLARRYFAQHGHTRHSHVIYSTDQLLAFEKQAAGMLVVVLAVQVGCRVQQSQPACGCAAAGLHACPVPDQHRAARTAGPRPPHNAAQVVRKKSSTALASDFLLYAHAVAAALCYYMDKRICVVYGVLFALLWLLLPPPLHRGSTNVRLLAAPPTLAAWSRPASGAMVHHSSELQPARASALTAGAGWQCWPPARQGHARLRYSRSCHDTVCAALI